MYFYFNANRRAEKNYKIFMMQIRQETVLGQTELLNI